MRKTIILSVFITSLVFSGSASMVHATTRVEMLQQIELLTKLISLLKQLRGSDEVGAIDSDVLKNKEIYYIESGEVTVDKNSKSIIATLMFGLGDVITVNTTYTEEKKVLDDILLSVKKTRPMAQYVNEKSN